MFGNNNINQREHSYIHMRNVSIIADFVLKQFVMVPVPTLLYTFHIPQVRNESRNQSKNVLMVIYLH